MNKAIFGAKIYDGREEQEVCERHMRLRNLEKGLYEMKNIFNRITSNLSGN